MEPTAETLPLSFLLLIKQIYGNQEEESSARGTGKNNATTHRVQLLPWLPSPAKEQIPLRSSLPPAGVIGKNKRKKQPPRGLMAEML